jgi:hypothetical protein
MRSYRVLGAAAGVVLAVCVALTATTPPETQQSSAAQPPATTIPLLVLTTEPQHEPEPPAPEPPPVAQPQPVVDEPRVAARATTCGDDFDCFRECTIAKESGGDYSINTGNGYYGAWQFHQPTWDAVTAGMGLHEWVGQRASDAPAHVQDAAARTLWQQRGNQPWGGRC